MIRLALAMLLLAATAAADDLPVCTAGWKDSCHVPSSQADCPSGTVYLRGEIVSDCHPALPCSRAALISALEAEVAFDTPSRGWGDDLVFSSPSSQLREQADALDRRDRQIHDLRRLLASCALKEQP